MSQVQIESAKEIDNLCSVLIGKCLVQHRGYAGLKNIEKLFILLCVFVVWWNWQADKIWFKGYSI